MHLAAILPGDTLGAFCARHQLSRESFFALNPHKAVFYTASGVRTTDVVEGEPLRVGTSDDITTVVQGTPLTSAEQARYDRCIAKGGVYDRPRNRCCDAYNYERDGKCEFDNMIYDDLDDSRQDVSAAAMVGVAVGVVGTTALLWYFWKRR